MILKIWPDGSVMCECPEPLSMWWHYPERGWMWQYHVTVVSNPEDDAGNYDASGADAYAIACDACRTQYAPLRSKGPNPYTDHENGEAS